MVKERQIKGHPIQTKYLLDFGQWHANKSFLLLKKKKNI